MYSRGQFAIIGKVGRKALRIYHEEGLLVPAFINGENGYHYYDESQLAVLEKIKRLRKIGLSLYEIKLVLKGKATEKELVEFKIREMDSRLQEARELANDERELPQNKNQNAKATLDICPFEKCRCLYIDENIELENFGMSVGKLYERASREGFVPAGNHFVIYDDVTDEEFSMRTCLPVSDYTGQDAIEVFEEKCLHLKFTGGFSKVGPAHLIIKDFADSQKIKFSGKVYEVYNKDMSVDVYYSIKND